MRRVGSQLRAEVQAAVKGRSKDAEAYRLYLQGSFFLNRYNDADMTKAIGYFRRALELDPEYALAWASLSSCLYGPGRKWLGTLRRGVRIAPGMRRDERSKWNRILQRVTGRWARCRCSTIGTGRAPSRPFGARCVWRRRTRSCPCVPPG